MTDASESDRSRAAETDPLLETERTDPDLATTATNDAVAGETVLPQAGDGPDGPTGGAPREQEPLMAEQREFAGEDGDDDLDSGFGGAGELDDEDR